MALGVDISENNGYVDFEMLREAGVEFIIARAGYGMGHEDGCFSHYVETARDYGFRLGAYWFSYSLDPEQARQEGQYAASIVSATDCLFELPIFYDTENSSWRDTHGWDSSLATAECEAFMEGLNGLNGGVYANLNWFSNILDYDALKAKYPIWLAEYSSEPDLECAIWQYSDSGEFGDGKAFDVNTCQF